MEGMSKYSRIIGLPHPAPRRHARMPLAGRAAQFSPFAALVGYGELIEDETRLTEEKPEWTEESLERLNRSLQNLSRAVKGKRPVRLIYFEADDRKSGGCWREYRGPVIRLDETAGQLKLADGLAVSFGDIRSIEEDKP